MKNSKQIFVYIVAVLLCLSLESFGQAKRAADANAPTISTSRTGVRYWDRSAPLNLSLGTGLAIFNGSTGWALNVNALTKVTSDLPLYVGADLGLNFWNYSSTFDGRSVGATGIQLLPTAIYGFTVDAWKSVYPYAGISVGPHIFVEKRQFPGTSVTDTSVLFELLFRVGANVQLSDDIALNLEPKLGLLRSDFIFLPQVSAAFFL